MIEMDDHEVGGHHSAVATEIDQRQAGKMSEPIANGLLVCRSESESGNIFDSSRAVECRSSIEHSILEINRRGVVSGARVGGQPAASAMTSNSISPFALGRGHCWLPQSAFWLWPSVAMRLLQRPDQRRVQGDLLLELIDYLRDKKISRIEAHQSSGGLARADRRHLGDRIVPACQVLVPGHERAGKVVESLNFPLGLPTYVAKFKESAANGYSGFKLN